jgi:hypothetical protein
MVSTAQVGNRWVSYGYDPVWGNDYIDAVGVLFDKYAALVVPCTMPDSI